MSGEPTSFKKKYRSHLLGMILLLISLGSFTLYFGGTSHRAEFTGIGFLLIITAATIALLIG